MTKQQAKTLHSAMAVIESYLFFNNSGDLNAIPLGFPPQGSATPKTSQAIANLTYWDAP